MPTGCPAWSSSPPWPRAGSPRRRSTTLDAGTGYTSIDITVNYTRPVTLDSGPLTATGRVTKPGRRIALATAEITDAAGRLVATASSNCLVIQAPG